MCVCVLCLFRSSYLDLLLHTAAVGMGEDSGSGNNGEYFESSEIIPLVFPQEDIHMNGVFTY